MQRLIRSFLPIVFSALAVCLTVISQQPASPPVFFNHAVVVVDDATYEAIRSSAFLRDSFSFVHESTARLNAQTEVHTGVFLLGRNTFIEIRKKSADQPQGREHVQLFFSVDQTSTVPVIVKRLKAGGAETQESVATIYARETDIPWYNLVAPTYGQGGHPASYLMAVLPSFLQAHNASTDPADVEMTREAQLHKGFRPAKLLQDISGFELHMRKEQAASLRRDLQAYGYRVQGTPEHFQANGPGCDFEVSSLTQDGTPSVVMRLAAADAPPFARQDFGAASSLDFNATTHTASWGFSWMNASQ